jgi:hypothetical protein
MLNINSFAPDCLDKLLHFRVVRVPFACLLQSYKHSYPSLSMIVSLSPSSVFTAILLLDLWSYSLAYPSPDTNVATSIWSLDIQLRPQPVRNATRHAEWARRQKVALEAKYDDLSDSSHRRRASGFNSYVCLIKFVVSHLISSVLLGQGEQPER